MKKLSAWYGPHLAIREVSLRPGEEWLPRTAAWALIQVVSGSGYWLRPEIQHLLEPDVVLFLAPELQGNFRASQLGGLHLCFIPVEPERLIGLFTLDEQRMFQVAASKREMSLKILPAESALAIKMKALCSSRNRSGVSFRFQLLQLFFEAVGSDPTESMTQPKVMPDAKDRLRELLQTTPMSELLTMNFSELGKLTRCTPRHLSRIFQEVVGVSFRDKHTELRLARACELLATTEAKIVDVALESGYQSLSLFNLMFSRRYGVSPGRWRQTLRKQHSPPPSQRSDRSFAASQLRPDR